MENLLFAFDESSAVLGDSTGFVSEGGNYIVTLDKVEVGKNTNGTSFMQLNGVTDTGSKMNFLTLYYRNNKKEGLPALNKINAMLGILGISNVTYYESQENGKTVYRAKELEGITVGIGVKRVDQDTFDGKGNRRFNLDLLHFYDPNTLKTYTEKRNNLEAKTWYLPIRDELKTGQQDTSFGGGFGGGNKFEQNQNVQQTGQGLPVEDELPF